MDVAQKISVLEEQLNNFDLKTRTQALAELTALARQGRIELSPPADVANMHCHTFFSFNGYGHSPTSLAWLGKKRGFKLMGIVDFDVLDAVDEFLTTCDMVGLRGSAGSCGRASAWWFRAARCDRSAAGSANATCSSPAWPC